MTGAPGFCHLIVRIDLEIIFILSQEILVLLSCMGLRWTSNQHTAPTRRHTEMLCAEVFFLGFIANERYLGWEGIQR